MDFDAIALKGDIAMEQTFYEIILDHFEQPRCYGTLSNPTTEMTVTNPLCGDVITLQLTVDLSNERIIALAWQGHGCTLSQAAASFVAEQCHNQRIDRALNMDITMLTNAFGVAAVKARPRCATLAIDAVRGALQRFDPS